MSPFETFLRRRAPCPADYGYTGPMKDLILYESMKSLEREGVRIGVQLEGDVLCEAWKISPVLLS